ncbi:MAG TPA: hypothetical protein VJP77_08310, partial [Planctomycetota bacterium]|nr:hypothetical protein [Planctomycetota bacterium]
MRTLPLLLLTLGASPGPPVTWVLDPSDHASPSGEWVLHRAPSARDGAGPAKYALRRAGEFVWSGERPFTFQELVVADDGRAFGYAFSGGQGGQSPWGAGELVVGLLGPDGAVLLHERSPLGGSRSPDGPPLPLPLEVVDASEHGWFGLRVEDRGKDFQVHRALRRYASTTGERLRDGRLDAPRVADGPSHVEPVGSEPFPDEPAGVVAPPTDSVALLRLGSIALE